MSVGVLLLCLLGACGAEYVTSNQPDDHNGALCAAFGNECLPQASCDAQGRQHVRGSFCPPYYDPYYGNQQPHVCCLRNPLPLDWANVTNEHLWVLDASETLCESLGNECASYCGAKVALQGVCRRGKTCCLRHASDVRPLCHEAGGSCDTTCDGVSEAVSGALCPSRDERLVCCRTSLWKSSAAFVFTLLFCLLWERVVPSLADWLCWLMMQWAFLYRQWWQTLSAMTFLVSFFVEDGIFWVAFMQFIAEIGTRLSPPVDLDSKIRIIATRSIRVRALRADAPSRALLLANLRFVVERSGAFDFSAELARSSTFAEMLDAWLLALRSDNAEIPRASQELSATLHAACKKTIDEFEAHGPRVASSLSELSALKGELAAWINGSDGNQKSKVVADPSSAILELAAWSTAQDDRREQLRIASERSCAALQAALRSTGALFGDDVVVANVEAWSSASKRIDEALDDISAELLFYATSAMPKPLAVKVSASVLSSCAELQIELERLQRTAERARACESALQVGAAAPADAHMCIVCMEAPKIVMMEPCRHLNLCQRCADGVDHCPTCRALVVDRKVVYL
jgi:hypothetical protein